MNRQTHTTSPATARATMHPPWRTLATLLFAFAAVSCSDDPVGHEHALADVTIAPATATLKVGGEVTFTASPVCSCGDALQTHVTWTTSDAAVATVADGNVEALAVGTATITAHAGAYSASATVEVEPTGVLVGPEGALLTSEDGAVELEIPAGALSVATDVVITPPDDWEDWLFDGPPDLVLATVYEIRPLNVQLQEHARLRIHYLAGHVPEGGTHERLRLREWDHEQNQWRQTERNRLREHGVEGEIGHFGTFAIVVGPPGALVGTEGGLVASEDGVLQLEIPAGALEEWTEITVEAVDDDAFTGDALYVHGTAYDVGPDQLQLNEQARLRIHFDPANVPDGVAHEELRLRERDRERHRWREMQQTTLREQEHALETNVEHLGLFAVVAAGGDGAPVATVNVSPAALNLVAGGHATLVASVYDVDGNLLQRLVTWTSANAGVASVDASGVVTGVAAGQSTITATSGGVTGTAEVTVSPQVATTVVVSPASFAIEVDETIQLTAKVLDQGGGTMSVPVTWSTTDASVATVDDNGVVRGVAEGDVQITAQAGGAQGGSGGQVGPKTPQPARIDVTPASLGLTIGATGALTAVAYDADENVLDVAVTWSSSSVAVATVDASGLVTAVALGTATISAKVKNVTGTASVTVTQSGASVVIDPIGNEPLEVGLTLQLTATAYDISGTPIDVTINWASGAPSIATVDATGLVTGVGRGTATITASVGSAQDAVEVRVVGESEEGTGNNLSWPVVFADGIGITGAVVSSDPGIRPTAAEGITVDSLPFFWEGNVPTYGTYYEQQTFNTWVAEWIDGTGQGAYDTQIFWGDNLTHQTWSASRPIRVEQTLYATGVEPLTGFVMTYLQGQGPDEMQGTDGSTATFTPTLYTVGPTLLVEKLSGPGGSVVGTVVNETVGSEVNVGGKIIFGYNLGLSTWTPPAGVTLDGWYRLTFAVASGGNAQLTSVGNEGDDLAYVPTLDAARNRSSLEIYVKP